MSDYSIEEKIDFVFKELKYQKKARLSKLIFRLIFIALIIFVYFSIIQWLDKDKLIEKFSSQIFEIITPITQDLVKNLVDDNVESVKSLAQ